MTAAIDYGSFNDRGSLEDNDTHSSSSRPSSSAALTYISIGSAIFASILLFLSPSTTHQLPLLKMMAQQTTTDNNLIPDPSAYPHRLFIKRTNTTIPILGFPSVALARLSDPTQQPLANRAVHHAVEDLQIGYFDVAPEYGDGVAQERLGPALKPYRDNVFLAAKTMFRTEEGSRQDLENTLRALQTDHLDLYQFHSISTQDDVNEILGPNGAMKTFQKAKAEGKIRAIGFSAHSEPMAIQMIQSGLVDTCMFPINFVSYHYGGVGQGVLDAALANGVGVIALKSGARGRLTTQSGDAVHVPQQFHHIPEWKRQEMIHYPVVTSPKYYTWYEPEDDPVELNKLVLWALNQKGVTAVLPPGTMDLLDGISDMVRGKGEVPVLSEEDVEGMKRRYEGMDIVPIFHNWSMSGTKVST
eukprot:scaffold10921_cov210-Skeletonema_marinoi.AAC.4